MESITKKEDGTWHWSCSIDRDLHRGAALKGLWGVLLICAFVFILFLSISHGPDMKDDLWIPLLVNGVILAVSLPLLVLWYMASDPHEQYEMTETYVRSGYGKSSVYTDFKKTKKAAVTSKYIELTDNRRSSRIYIPAEDMDFVREFILERIPDDVAVRYEK